MTIVNGQGSSAQLGKTPLISWRNAGAVQQHGMRSMIRVRQKAGMVKQPKPLVGFTGINNSISVARRPDGIRCRVSTSSYLFVLAGTALFGPVLGSVLFFWPEKLEPHTPSLILGAVWFLSFLSLVVFTRYALGCPRFIVNYGTGEIRYFAWWGPRPSLVLHREEIKSIEVEERFFLDEGNKTPNFCVTVTTQQDKRYALCVSTDQQMISALKSDLENARFGRI
jgi:hypothetical protein